MKTKLVYVAAMMATLGLGKLHAQEAQKKEPSGAHVPGDLTTPPLRQPGFMFTEFGTPKVEEYVTYFEKVAGYRVVYRKPGYVEMETSCAQVTFLDPAIWPKAHPFYNPPPDGKRGHSMEIGLVVADLDKGTRLLPRPLNSRPRDGRFPPAL